MGLNEEVTLLCAVRYAMGRSSYAPSCVIEHIKGRKKAMKGYGLKKFIGNVQQDILEQEADFPYKKEWKELVEFLKIQ